MLRIGEVMVTGPCDNPGCSSYKLMLRVLGREYEWCPSCETVTMSDITNARSAVVRQAGGDGSSLISEGSHLLSSVADPDPLDNPAGRYRYPGDDIETGPGGDL
jgi:hypothetical protein